MMFQGFQGEDFLEGFLGGEAKLPSRDQVRCQRTLPEDQIQESRGASGQLLDWRAAEMARLLWIPEFWSSGRPAGRLR